MFKIRMELVEWSDKLTKRRMIRVGIVDTVEGLTLIGRKIGIDLDKQLEQGHTLWFDLGLSDFEERCGYTRCYCIRKDLDHAGIRLLLRRRILEMEIDIERLMKQGRRGRTGEYQRQVDTDEVETTSRTLIEVD